MAKEAIFYLDLILEDESDEHPAYLDFQGGKIAETAEAPPAGAVGLLLKETELGNSLFGGLIHGA